MPVLIECGSTASEDEIIPSSNKLMPECGDTCEIKAEDKEPPGLVEKPIHKEITNNKIQDSSISVSVASNEQSIQLQQSISEGTTAMEELSNAVEESSNVKADLIEIYSRVRVITAEGFENDADDKDAKEIPGECPVNNGKIDIG